MTGEEGGGSYLLANDKQHRSLVSFPHTRLFLLATILDCCECCLVLMEVTVERTWKRSAFVCQWLGEQWSAPTWQPRVLLLLRNTDCSRSKSLTSQNRQKYLECLHHLSDLKKMVDIVKTGIRHRRMHTLSYHRGRDASPLSR